jgi:hypothetical protein
MTPFEHKRDTFPVPSMSSYASTSARPYTPSISSISGHSGNTPNTSVTLSSILKDVRSLVGSFFTSASVTTGHNTISDLQTGNDGTMNTLNRVSGRGAIDPQGVTAYGQKTPGLRPGDPNDASALATHRLLAAQQRAQQDQQAPPPRSRPARGRQDPMR